MCCRTAIHGQIRTVRWSIISISHASPHVRQMARMPSAHRNLTGHMGYWPTDALNQIITPLSGGTIHG